MIDLDIGLGDEALFTLEESLPDAVRADDFQTSVPHWGQIARAYAAHGQIDKMTDVISRLLEFVKTRGFQSHESIMPLLTSSRLMASQNTPTSVHVVQSCLSLLERLDRQFQTVESATAVAEARGYKRLAEKQASSAARHFRQAVTSWEKIERRYDQVRALGSLAQALQSLSDPQAMEAACREAEAIITSLVNLLDRDLRASFLDSAMVRQIYEIGQPESGITVRAKQVIENIASPLTSRETEVLRHVSQGLTNEQIAKALYISKLTVNAHLRSIFGKLDVANRTAAVHRAKELELF